MHVDGFRFDLASVFGRDRFGNVMVDPPVVETITEDGVLADSKLIAEPWERLDCTRSANSRLADAGANGMANIATTRGGSR